MKLRQELSKRRVQVGDFVLTAVLLSDVVEGD